ncbi:hypothetical protein MRB53_013981 [Persea americana]|uniref:Uncharacterized protein n=1 Tax=Persea americana TaxID=3435 RepID=A0ACC2K9M2_PERAE|nr:hypothetical protein MRB53_013981 [Persea americana]
MGATVAWRFWSPVQWPSFVSALLYFQNLRPSPLKRQCRLVCPETGSKSLILCVSLYSTAASAIESDFKTCLSFNSGVSSGS